MSKKEKTWLALAARAQHYKTVDTHHAVKSIRAEVELQSQRHSSWQAELQSLTGLWLQRRQDSQLDAASDTAFRHFHAHLHTGTEEASRAKQSAEQRFELAQEELKHSFGTQKLLQHVVKRTQQLQERAHQTLELRLAGEAWLLSRRGCQGQEPSGDEY